MLIKIDPLPKPRMTQKDRWAKRPCVLRYWEYKDKLNALLDDIPASCRVIFHLPMPKSWSKKKKKEMIGKPHQQRPDIDNLIKAVFDCICKEDSYIWHVESSKYWAEEGSIEIEEII